MHSGDGEVGFAHAVSEPINLPPCVAKNKKEENRMRS
tara:strand:+ start:212 stop:322 length:111 start_codon:yes stop_codon:yes gene_type:complete